MTIKARILKVEPTTEHEGIVYDQNVVIELPSGTTIGVFDMDMLVDEGMVGEMRDLKISLLVGKSSIESCTGVELHIDPSRNEPEFWKNHIYYGVVGSVSEEEGHYVISLDVGEGQVNVQTKKETFPIPENGDSLRIQASRSDLRGVN